MQHCAFRTLGFLLPVLAILPAVARAQDKPKPRELTADVGYVSTSGNTDVSA